MNKHEGRIMLTKWLLPIILIPFGLFVSQYVVSYADGLRGTAVMEMSESTYNNLMAVPQPVMR